MGQGDLTRAAAKDISTYHTIPNPAFDSAIVCILVKSFIATVNTGQDQACGPCRVLDLADGQREEKTLSCVVRAKVSTNETG